MIDRKFKTSHINFVSWFCCFYTYQKFVGSAYVKMKEIHYPEYENNFVHSCTIWTLANQSLKITK